VQDAVLEAEGDDLTPALDEVVRQGRQVHLGLVTGGGEHPLDEVLVDAAAQLESLEGGLLQGGLGALAASSGSVGEQHGQGHIEGGGDHSGQGRPGGHVNAGAGFRHGKEVLVGSEGCGGPGVLERGHLGDDGLLLGGGGGFNLEGDAGECDGEGVAGFEVFLVCLGPVHGAHEVGFAPLFAGETVDEGADEGVGLVGLVAALVDDVDAGAAVEDDPFGVWYGDGRRVFEGYGADEEGVDVGFVGCVVGAGDALDAGDGDGGDLAAGGDAVDDHAVGVEGGFVADAGVVAEEDAVEALLDFFGELAGFGEGGPHVGAADVDASFNDGVVGGQTS